MNWVDVVPLIVQVWYVAIPVAVLLASVSCAVSMVCCTAEVGGVVDVTGGAIRAGA